MIFEIDMEISSIQRFSSSPTCEGGGQHEPDDVSSLHA
jgi:hypothetical protein